MYLLWLDQFRGILYGLVFYGVKWETLTYLERGQ